MERIRTRIIIAVTGKLSAAADCEAKTELIEELSENLYERYLEFTASGMSEEEAYARTLEELGDVDELLECLGGKEPGRSSQSVFGQSSFGQNVEELCRDAMDVAQKAVEESKGFLRDLGAKIKEKYPHGFGKSFTIHMDEDKDIVWTDEGGDGSSETVIPAENVKVIELSVCSANVEVGEADAGDGSIILNTEDVNLKISRDDATGKLVISEPERIPLRLRHGRVELLLPPRHWERVSLSTANGDLEIPDGLDAGEASLRTANGDITCGSVPGKLRVNIASGDITLEGDYTDVRLKAASGDISLSGGFDSLDVASASGDIELNGDAGSVKCRATSGDISLELESLPERVELSTVSGDCTLRIPGDKGFTLGYRILSGSIRSDFELSGEKGEKTYLDGGSSRITFSTTSGDLSLENS